MRHFQIFAIALIFYLLFAQGCMRMRTSDEKANKAFKTHKVNFQTHSLFIFGAPFHYVSAGNEEGPILFFVHGSPGSWNAFEAFLKDSLLAKEYHLLAIDRPGFGYSQFGNALNLFEQAKIIGGFIEGLKITKPLYLIGHSYGGPLVLQLASDTSLHISGAMVLAGSTSPYLENPEKWRIPFLYMAALVPGALRVSNAELWWLKSDLYLLEKNLPKITTQVSWVHGTKDRLVPYLNMQYGYNKLSAAVKKDTLSIEGADHFIPWTHYTEVKLALLRLVRPKNISAE